MTTSNSNPNPPPLRFQPGERIIWKVGTVWKSGTLIVAARTRAEANAQIPPGYTLDTPKSNASGPFYYVAEDTPLFAGIGHLHSIRERHLQKESQSWAHIENQLNRIKIEPSKLYDFFLTIAQYAHKKRQKTPPEILDILHSTAPSVFSKRSQS